MGRDRSCTGRKPTRTNFNPLSPHGERHTAGQWAWASRGFQSTLPAWGETKDASKMPKGVPISIHSPRMGRDRTQHGDAPRAAISIHSPRMGRDILRIAYYVNTFLFQSTLPAWGETTINGELANDFLFQSTLPAWGETRRTASVRHPPQDFNPLSPHGERRRSRGEIVHGIKFQSTLPAWGETIHAQRLHVDGKISIHSPRMGRDGR